MTDCSPKCRQLGDIYTSNQLHLDKAEKSLANSSVLPCALVREVLYNQGLRTWTVLLYGGGGEVSLLVIPHRARHSSVPQFAPVPIAGMPSLVFLVAQLNPKAAFSSSKGMSPVKSWLRFDVPASGLLRAEMSIASSQARTALASD